ncbi:GGDEF domain-containing protein [Inhella proteolytica]|uniref:diguanylate cyclase n=1 Tax=Inhella proteolytica TaxID=2795029 RepID=A0A931J8X5_9BURK|nr:GGDEF domain-containing protein [Inhella proteolytica]MBH9579719.1 diguanylate cyclase [Inhella proteolytica]
MQDSECQSAEALLQQGNHSAAALRLEALLPQAQGGPERARVLNDLARAYARLGRPQDCVRVASEAVHLLERQEALGPLCEARCNLSLAYSLLSLGREALEQALSALNLARRLQDPEREGWALARLGNAYAALDNPAQARETTQLAREIALQHGLPELDFACLNNQAFFTLYEYEELVIDGETEQAVVVQAMAQLLSEQAVACAQAQGNPYRIALALSNLVEALLQGQDWDRAAPLIEYLDQTAQEHEFAGLAISTRLHRAVLARGRGQHAEAIAAAESLLQLRGDAILPRLQRRALRLLYECHKTAGAHEAALADLEALMRAERLAIRTVQLAQTEVLLIRQEVDQAMARAEHARADAERERERVLALEREHEALREQLARSDRAAREDVLTRLANRRHAEQALPLMWEQTPSPDTPFAVAMLDIDHFKRVNDQFGHAVGDAVLRELAQLLRQRLRSADLLARWGGEEFLIGLVGPPARDAEAVLERLRSAVMEHPWERVHGGLRLTISIGLALRGVGNGAPAEEPRELVQAADIALYQAKHAGRNRLRLA